MGGRMSRKPRYITRENCFEILSIDQETDCWIIHLPIGGDKRMGTYRFEGKKTRPVNIYWKIVKGDFPKGELWRSCDNVLCVNPEHYNHFTSVKDRLLAKISFDEKTGCWNWTGSVDTGGYGHMRIGDDLVRPHRFSYEHYVGRIPDGHGVLHKCDNRRCCNPAHLFTGTNKDNALDREIKGRGAGSKVTPDQVREIRELKNSGLSAKEIAARYNIKYKTIYQITSRHTWKWVL
jgi:hypothetical protein